MSDGVRTTTGPGANAALSRVNIATNASGLPSSYSLIAQRTPGPPYLVATPSDPNSRASLVSISNFDSGAVGNIICMSRGSEGGGVNVCGDTDYNSDDNSSFAGSSNPSVVTLTSGAAAVPTLSEWALILFGLILAGGAALYIQRRRSIA
jgi:hypothetical protein